MAKLCEDARVATMAVDSAVAHDTFLNEWQDQVRGMVKTLDLDITSLFHADWGDSWAPDYATGGANSPGFRSDAAAGAQLTWAQLPLRVGQKITQVDITYQGITQNGGSMALYKQEMRAVGNGASPDAGAPSSLYDIGENAANPWNPTANPNNWHRVQTATSVIIESGWRYYIGIEKSAAAAIHRVSQVYISAQFGN
ncbi:MAG: hypothetical protein ACYTEQ_20750 [Planctomycetota bacterium]|jgi:hypothetical protein